MAKRNNIPLYALMDTQGRMRADGLPYDQAAARAQAIADGSEAAPEDATEINLVPDAYRGLDRFEARKRVVEDVTAEGLAVMTEATDPRLGRAAKKAPVEPGEGGEMRTEEENLVPLVEAKKIMQPFGDRSKVVIEPMLTDQWFVATDKIVQPAIDAVRSGEVTILPEQDRKVYFHWLENIEPWCISRQLWWGHQIPVWYGPEINKELSEEPYVVGTDQTVWLSYLDKKAFCAADYETAKGDMIDSYGDLEVIVVESQYEAIVRTGNAKRDTNNNPLQVFVWRDPDVLDTWFSSGLWPIGTLGWPEQTAELEKYFPTSVLVTGFDIIFFWVARMMMMQYAVVDQKPFDTVYVHALVRDEKGKKMSKSLGNVLDPLELIDDFGADAVRFTVTSMAAMGRDLKLSTQRIAGYRNFGTKLWNAHRFAEMNNVFASMPAAMPQPQATLNKWIVGETARIREEVDAALGNFRFNDAANALYAFVWGKGCDWYVELSKPLLQDDAPEAEETRATMAWVLEQCLVLLHPIMPFITEELWQTTTKRDQLLALTDWPTYTTADLLDAEADRELNWVIGLIESIRSARQQMHVPAGLKVPMLVTEMDEAAQGAWDRNEVMIKRLARVESLEKTDSFPKGREGAVAKVARQAGQGDRRAEGAFEQPQVCGLSAGRGCRRGAGQSGRASGRGGPVAGGAGPSGRTGLRLRAWRFSCHAKNVTRAGQRQTAGWRSRHFSWAVYPCRAYDRIPGRHSNS